MTTNNNASWTARQVLNIAAANIATVADLQTTAMRAATLGYLKMTRWTAEPVKVAKAKEAMGVLMLAAGIEKTIWQTYAAHIVRFADKLGNRMSEDVAVLACRDAADAEAALARMGELFAFLGVVRPYHVKLWAAQESCGKVEPVKAKEPSLACLDDGSTTATATATGEMATGNPVQALPLMGSVLAAIEACASEADLAAILVAANARLVSVRSVASEAEVANVPAKAHKVGKHAKVA